MAFKLKGYNYPGTSPKKFIPPNQNPDLQGQNIDGEYRLSAEERVDPLAKQKILAENSDVKFEGEHAAMVTKKRRKKKRMTRRGKHMDWTTGEYV